MPRLPRGQTPDMKTTFAALAGGGGGALLGGLLANRGWNPEMVALAMTVGGGVGAYTLGGNWRIAANGLAAAGAGQLALALLARQAEKDARSEKGKDGKEVAQLPAPNGAPARQNAGPVTRGTVLSMFELARKRTEPEEVDGADQERDEEDRYAA